MEYKELYITQRTHRVMCIRSQILYVAALSFIIIIF